MFHRSNITYYVSFMGANMIVINEPSEHKNNNKFIHSFIFHLFIYRLALECRKSHDTIL